MPRNNCPGTGGACYPGTDECYYIFAMGLCDHSRGVYAGVSTGLSTFEMSRKVKHSVEGVHEVISLENERVLDYVAKKANVPILYGWVDKDHNVDDHPQGHLPPTMHCPKTKRPRRKK